MALPGRRTTGLPIGPKELPPNRRPHLPLPALDRLLVALDGPGDGGPEASSPGP
jgi:hypothetical protein